MSPLDQLRAEMIQAVRIWQLVNTCPPDVDTIVDIITTGWVVKKKTAREGDERYYTIATPKREPTTREAEEDAAREARRSWVYGPRDEEEPPPLSVSMLDLMDQRTWWITGDKRVVRIDGMTPEHRENLLEHLKKRAIGLQSAEWFSGIFTNAPDEVADQAAEEDPIHWLYRQEFVKRLRKLIKKDRRVKRGES